MRRIEVVADGRCAAAGLGSKAARIALSALSASAPQRPSAPRVLLQAQGAWVVGAKESQQLTGIRRRSLWGSTSAVVSTLSGRAS